MCGVNWAWKYDSGVFGVIPVLLGCFANRSETKPNATNDLTYFEE